MKNNRYFYIRDIDHVTTVTYTTRKNLLQALNDMLESIKYGWDCSEDAIQILYKDGTQDFITDESYDGHKIRRQNIASMTFTHANGQEVYGHFSINEYGDIAPAFEDEISEELKEVDSEDYTEIELTTEPEQVQAEPEQATAETVKEAELIAEATEPESTYEHAVEMAKYAVKCGDGIQAIYRKGNEYKAGLASDRAYAGSHGWKFVETVETEQAETAKSENAEISAQEHTDTKVLETPFSQTVYVDCLLNDVLAFNKAFDDLMKMRQVNERIPRPPPMILHSSIKNL